MDAELQKLKDSLDAYYGLSSACKLYDAEQKFATLHYYSPNGVEMFYVSVRNCGEWKIVVGRWSGL